MLISVTTLQVHSPQGRDVKKIFASYKLNPAPTVFDIDERGKLISVVAFCSLVLIIGRSD